MIIGITGRIAAGKETVTEFLRQKDFSYYTLSRILRDELEKQGIPITRKGLQDHGDLLRNKHGPGILMKIYLDKLNPEEYHIIDGIRNPGEVEELRKHNAVLIGLDAPQKLRFERVLKRAKPSDPKTWEGFLEVDNRDFADSKDPLGQQVGKCMELADFLIVNDGDLEGSMKRIQEIWEQIKEKGESFFSIIKIINL